MSPDTWQKIKDIFEQATALAPAERPQFLNKVCSDNKIVRREVEELLNSFENAESFLEAPVVAKPKNELKEGQILAHYTIVKMLGAGGMGEVYLAKDTKLDRQVAIKILNQKFASQQSNLNRFIQEAKAASALNHPNILVIHEIGESGDTHYIVSEFIEGKTLREHFGKTPLKLAEVLDFSIQIANALLTAHTAHIVHRDIKPENIIVRPDGLVKILDFGLAKLVEQKVVGLEESTVKQNETAKGLILGTVNYMSPEQAKGEKIDGRTDIFSLGVVIYEMVTGRVPFESESVLETITKLLNREPSPLARFAPDVPDELQRMVTKMLRKNKDERYQTMKGLLTDLKDLRETLAFGERLGKTPPSEAENETRQFQVTTHDANFQSGKTNYSFARQIKRYNPLVAVGLIVMLGVIGFGYWFFVNHNTKPIESIAVMPFINESGNADIEYLSDGMTETLISSLSNLPNLNVKARSSVFRYKGKELDPKKIAAELNVQAILTGQVVQRGDQLTINLELIDAQTENRLWGNKYERKSSELVSLQSEIARDVSSNLKAKLSGAETAKVEKNYTTNPEAYQFYLKGRFYWNKRTAEGMLKGIEYFNQAIIADPKYALAYAGLADCYILRAAPFSPKERLQNAKTAVTRALEIDETLAEAHTSLGRIKSDYEWDWDGAEREYQRALELNPNYATTHQWFALYLSAVGRNDEAIREATRANELEPLSLSINTTLVWIFFFTGNNDKALAQLNKTLEMDPNFADAFYASAYVYEEQKLYPEAIAASQKAIKLDDDPKLLAELGYLYAVSGKLAEAKQILIQLEQLPKQKYIPSYNVARIYFALGENEKVIKWLERAFEEHQPDVRNLMRKNEWSNNLRSDPRFQDLMRRIGLAP